MPNKQKKAPTVAAKPQPKSNRPLKGKRMKSVENVNWGVPSGTVVTSGGSNGATRIRYEEKWSDVTVPAGATQLVLKLLFSPGASGLPRCDQYGAMFDQYRVKRFVPKFRTSSGTVTNGSILMALDYDVRDLPDAAYIEVLSPRARTALWQNCEIPHSKAVIDRIMKAKWLYTSSSSQDPTPGTSGDAMQTGVALVVLCTAAAGVAAGEIWLDYELEFVGPQPSRYSTKQKVSNVVAQVDYNGSGASPAVPSATGRVLSEVDNYLGTGTIANAVNASLASFTVDGTEYTNIPGIEWAQKVFEDFGMKKGELYHAVHNFSTYWDNGAGNWTGGSAASVGDIAKHWATEMAAMGHQVLSYGFSSNDSSGAYLQPTASMNAVFSPVTDAAVDPGQSVLTVGSTFFRPNGATYDSGVSYSGSLDALALPLATFLLQQSPMIVNEGTQSVAYRTNSMREYIAKRKRAGLHNEPTTDLVNLLSRTLASGKRV
jgi:hypothetical protein